MKGWGDMWFVLSVKLLIFWQIGTLVILFQPCGLRICLIGCSEECVKNYGGSEIFHNCSLQVSLPHFYSC